MWDSNASPERIDGDLEQISSLSQTLQEFWSRAHGWAPAKAAEGLSAARLDWLASFSRTLKHRVAEVRAHPDEPSTLIIAWAHLRVLVEGNLQFFLTVFLMDYLNDPQLIKHKKAGDPVLPRDLSFEQLRQFLKKKDKIGRAHV